jgi:hypothetical protein
VWFVLSAYIGESDESSTQLRRELEAAETSENTKSSQSAGLRARGYPIPCTTEPRCFAPEDSLLPRGARRILSAPVRTSKAECANAHFPSAHKSKSFPAPACLTFLKRSRTRTLEYPHRNFNGNAYR